MKFENIYKQVLKFFLTIFLLVVIFRKMDFSSFSNVFSQINYFFLFLPFLLLFLHVYLKSIKWLLLIRTVNNKTSIFDSFFSYLRGTALAIITPFRAGELARVSNLKGDKWKFGLLVVVDKIIELWVILVFSLGGIYYYTNNLVLICSIIVLTVGLVSLYKIKEAKRLLRRVSKIKIISKILKGLRLISSQILTRSLFLSTLTMIVFFLQAYFLLLAFGYNLLAATFLLFPLIMLLNLVPITIGGLGVREGAAALLLAQFGVPAAIAISVTLLLFLFDTILPGIIGSLSFLKKAK